MEIKKEYKLIFISEEKWIKEYERIINDVAFKTSVDYDIYSFKKYLGEFMNKKIIKI